MNSVIKCTTFIQQASFRNQVQERVVPQIILSSTKLQGEVADHQRGVILTTMQHEEEVMKAKDIMNLKNDRTML